MTLGLPKPGQRDVGIIVKLIRQTLLGVSFFLEEFLLFTTNFWINFNDVLLQSLQTVSCMNFNFFVDSIGEPFFVTSCNVPSKRD